MRCSKRKPRLSGRGGVGRRLPFPLRTQGGGVAYLAVVFMWRAIFQ